MAENDGEIDWLNMSAAERIEPTKALFVAMRKVSITTGRHIDLLLDDALGEAQSRGTDYESNFRKGKIAKFKAQKIYLWLARNHFELSQSVGPNLFIYRPLSAFQDFINIEAAVGKLRVVKVGKVIGLIERSSQKRKHIQTLRLSEKFCFEVDASISGVALAFQNYQGVWHPLALGADRKRMKADVAVGSVLLPKTADNQLIALEENDDAGNHQFVLVISENRNLSQDMNELAKTIRLNHSFEVHIVDVRFAT